MTHQEILEKAIQKAYEQGWQHEGFLRHQDLLDEIADTDMHKCLGNSAYSIIYRADFAKALWWKRGTAKMHYSYPINWGLFNDDELHTTTALLEEWQYHLQQMVIAEDPIKYLGENL